MQINNKNPTAVAFACVNPFQENTYILYDDSRECVLIDPGCYSVAEQQQIAVFIHQNKLTPTRCLLTHTHLDHIFGCAWVAETYGLLPEMHEGELELYHHAPASAERFGVPFLGALPQPAVPFLVTNEPISFGNTRLEIRFVPGHSPASICFYCAESGFVIAGDTLFAGSIGRTDLPGGNHNLLLQAIEKQLFTLPDATVVYSGHGSPTTIGREQTSNPYF